FAAGRALAAADPARELAEVGATLVVDDGGADAVGAAFVRVEGTGDGLGGGLHGAGLHIGFFFAPAAATVAPFQTRGADFKLAPGDGGAVDVDDDGFDFQGRALLHEGALAAQARVERGGVHQQGGV